MMGVGALTGWTKGCRGENTNRTVNVEEKNKIQNKPNTHTHTPSEYREFPPIYSSGCLGNRSTMFLGIDAKVLLTLFHLFSYIWNLDMKRGE